MKTFFSTAAALVLGAGIAGAAELATGEQIRAAIAGNTVQGSMVESGAYTEFYAADGTIRGKDYTGTWTIEGDSMCFAYGEAPSCWGVRIAGDQVTWVKDGADDGTGTIVAGNVNNY
jgi:hypothetical protein